MADQSEIYELIVKVQAAEKVRDLASNIEVASDALADYLAKNKLLTPALAAADAKAVALASGLADMNRQFREAARNAQQLGVNVNAIAGSTAAAAGGTRSMGSALLQASQAIDDVQYGLKGVLNNIPGLITSLGGSAGLAGAISITAVAAYQLYTHWDQLLALMTGDSPIVTETERLAVLEKQIHRTAKETAEYNKIKEQQGKVRQQENAKSELQKQTEKAIDEPLAEAGQKNVVAALSKNLPMTDPRANQLRDQAVAKEDEAKTYDQYQANATNRGAKADAQRFKLRAQEARDEAAKLRGEMRQRLDDLAANLIADASNGVAGKQDQLIKALIRAGGFDDLVKKLKEATPEALKKKADEAKDEKAGAAALKEAEKHIPALKEKVDDYLKNGVKDADVIATIKNNLVGTGVDSTRAAEQALKEGKRRKAEQDAKNDLDPDFAEKERKKALAQFEKANPTAREIVGNIAMRGLNKDEGFSPDRLAEIEQNMRDDLKTQEENIVKGGWNPEEAHAAMDQLFDEEMTKVLARMHANDFDPSAATHTAEQTIPGVEKLAAQQLKEERIRAGSNKAGDAAAEENLRKKLVGGGMGEEQAATAAAAIIKKAAGDLNEKLVQNGLDQPKIFAERQEEMAKAEEERRRNQFTGKEELIQYSDRLQQAALGPGVPEKQLEKLDSIDQQLTRLNNTALAEKGVKMPPVLLR